MNPVHSRPSRQHSPLVPLLISRPSYPSTVLNLLVVGLVALGAMWIVHQTEYAIEYGRRFGEVMAATPHRFYMAPTGLILGLLGATLALLCAGSLLRSRWLMRQLLPSIPERLRRHVMAPVPAIPADRVVRTAVALTVFQMTLYGIQENLESLAAGAGVPGLAVFLAPQHVAVIPLHALTALYCSLLLWTVAGLLHRTRRTVHLARVLAGIGTTRRRLRRPAKPRQGHVPNPRLRAYRRSLRSPPLAA